MADGSKREIIKPHRFSIFTYFQGLTERLDSMHKNEEITNHDVVKMIYTFSYKGIPFANLPVESKVAILQDNLLVLMFPPNDVLVFFRETEQGGLIDVAAKINKKRIIRYGEMLIADKEVIGERRPTKLFYNPDYGSWTSERVLARARIVNSGGGQTSITTTSSPFDFDDDD